MVQRVAASLALIVFAVCLVVGGIEAGNPFSTTVTRALVAMGGTYVIGLVVAFVGKKMLDEAAAAEEEKLRKSEAQIPSDDR